MMAVIICHRGIRVLPEVCYSRRTAQTLQQSQGWAAKLSCFGVVLLGTRLYLGTGVHRTLTCLVP